MINKEVDENEVMIVKDIERNKFLIFVTCTDT